jgi:hypothetical protein
VRVCGRVQERELMNGSLEAVTVEAKQDRHSSYQDSAK